MSLARQKCIFWNKRDNNNSDIGSNLTLNGTDTRVPVKFKNGYKSINSSSYESLASSPVGFNPNNFAISMPIKPSIAISNGSFVSDDRGTYFSWTDGVGNHVYLDTNFGITYTRFVVRISGIATIFTISTGFNLGVNEVGKILLAYNRLNIIGSEKFQFYFNGVKIASSTVDPGDQIVHAGSMWFNNNEVSSTLFFPGAIDNTKIFKEVDQSLCDSINAGDELEGFYTPGVMDKSIYNKMVGQKMVGKKMYGG